MGLRRTIVISVCMLSVIGVLAGCQHDETPQSEVHAGMKSAQKAQDAADETAKRVQDANKVLDGK